MRSTVVQAFSHSRIARFLLLAVLAIVAGAATGAATGTAATQPLFGPPSETPTGATPRDVVSGDLDEDGQPDLVVANYDAQNVTLLLGDGEGGIRTQSDHFTGSGPWSLAIADLDADGHDDVLCANKASDDIGVLLGGGDGTLAAVRRFAVGDRAYSVGVGDFDEDGNLDVAVGCSANATEERLVWVMLGDGAGNLVRGDSFAPGITPEAIVVEDLDGDGHADMAVASNQSDDVVVLRGLGHGDFQTLPSPAVGDAPVDLVSGDFDHDGEHDLVTANFGASSQTMLYGTGNGQFAGRQDHPAGHAPFGVAVGDFDDDQDLDVVVADALDDDIAVFLGDGAGGVQEARRFTTGAGSEPHGVAVADLDLDGIDDVAIANWGTDGVAILLSSGVPSPVAVSHVTAQARADAVLLEWETAFERDHAGFYLERSETGPRGATGPGGAGDDGTAAWSRLGSGLVVGPGPYRYADRTVRPSTSYGYRLIAVDRRGAIEIAACIEVTTPGAHSPEALSAGNGACVRLVVAPGAWPVELSFELAGTTDARL
ncbi:MAG: VCBS repeat-containing protein, partial [Candidatus Eiseniibacteriota bacterium]